jgi:hypothetical protein
MGFKMKNSNQGVRSRRASLASLVLSFITLRATRLQLLPDFDSLSPLLLFTLLGELAWNMNIRLAHRPLPPNKIKCCATHIGC